MYIMAIQDDDVIINAAKKTMKTTALFMKLNNIGLNVSQMN